MSSKRSLILLGAALSIAFGLSNRITPVFAASREQVLLRFNGTDGYRPNGALIFDSSGNLYGTTLQGGAYGRGSVFMLTPTANGKWAETELYSFCAAGSCSRGDGESGYLRQRERLGTQIPSTPLGTTRSLDLAQDHRIADLAGRYP